MNTPKNIEKLILELPSPAKPKSDDKIIEDCLSVLKSSRANSVIQRRGIANSRVFKHPLRKTAAVLLIAFTIVIVMSILPVNNRNSGLVFADVVTKMRNINYTFNLMFESTSETTFPVIVKASESGRLRFDASADMGELSSIFDLNSQECLILFHRQKAAQLLQTKAISENLGEAGFLTFLAQPIANLWDLRDGTEQKLGKKEIQNIPCEGFRIVQKNLKYQQRLTIWADVETSLPVLVEIVIEPQDKSLETVEFSLDQFVFNVQFDNSLFSMKPPAGYTLAFQKSMKELDSIPPATETAKQIEQSVERWSQGKEDEAIDVFVNVDWTKEFRFSSQYYALYLTKKDFISLKQEESGKIMTQIIETSRNARGLCRKVIQLGQSALAQENYDLAERYYNSVLNFGKLFNRNPDSMDISLMIGHAIQISALSEMETLYSKIDDEEKKSKASEMLNNIKSERELLKKRLSGKPSR